MALPDCAGGDQEGIMSIDQQQLGKVQPPRGSGMKLKSSPISAASPDMDDAQFNELVEDIRERGQLVPICVANGEVIDGRKRLRACELLNIEPKTVNVSDGDGADL